MAKALLTVLFLFMAMSFAYGGDTVMVGHGFNKRFLDDVVTMYVDSSKTAANTGFAGKDFTAVPCDVKSPGHMLNMGYTRNVWWLHWAVKNTTGERLNLKLYIGGGLINTAQLFVAENKDGIMVLDSFPAVGINHPYSPTYFNTKGWSYPVSLGAGETNEYWLRLQNDVASLRVPLELWQDEVYDAHLAFFNLGWGVFFGILFLTLLGSIAVFLATGQAVFAYYSLFISSIILLNSASLGAPVILFGANSAYLSHTYVLLVNILVVITMLLFSKTYLDVNKWAPWLNKVIYFTIALVLLFGVFWFFWPQTTPIPYWLVHVFTFLPLASIVIMMVAVLKQKRIPSQHKLFLVAFSPILLMSIAMALRNNGLLGHSILFEVRLPISFAFQAIVFSYALAIRIRDIRNERETLLEQMNIQQRDSFKAVIEATERERKRVAEDLHDGLGQLLSTAKLNLTSIEGNVGNDEMASISTSVALLDEACQEVRHISHNMMPGTLIRLGLVSAIKEQVRKINESGKILVTVTVSGLEQRLPEPKEIAIYRVVQELMNNAIRYANATDIEICMEELADGYLIKLKDNGKGFDPKTLEGSKGIGWRNIRSRIDLMQGNIDLKTAPGKGTLLHLWVPKKSKSG